MTAKEYLKQYKAKERTLKALRSKKVSYDISIGSMDYAKDRVQTSPTSGAAFEDNVLRALEKQTEIEHRIDALCYEMNEIKERVTSINDGVYRSVLYFRYIYGMSILQVADVMGYSMDHTQKLCSGAVRAFGIKYDLDQDVQDGYL